MENIGSLDHNEGEIPKFSVLEILLFLDSVIDFLLQKEWIVVIVDLCENSRTLQNPLDPQSWVPLNSNDRASIRESSDMKLLYALNQFAL